MAARKHPHLIDPGSRAPDFQLATLNDGQSALSGLLTAGPVLLAFFKVSCPVCQMTFPYLERIHAAGFRVYGISQKDAKHTVEFNRLVGIVLRDAIHTKSRRTMPNTRSSSTGNLASPSPLCWTTRSSASP